MDRVVEIMNDQFTRDLLAQLGGTVGQKLEARDVLSSAQTQEALSALSPVVLSSLKRKQETIGAASLEDLLADAGLSENSAEDIDDVLEKGMAGHTRQTEAVLDERTRNQTADALSQKLKIGGTLAKKLIPMLAPLIIGMLMKKGGKAAPAGGGGRASGISGILDRDGDGSIIDDIAGMVLGGGSRGGQRRGGFLQWILSFLFRRK